jgi:MFS transporter, SP family, general alpha glucoside:H+ symporter
VALRTYLLANVNMCWLIGQVIATGVLNACAAFDNQWQWRLPFGLQWVWSVPLLVVICWCPEAPWWLVRHGRDQEAHRALEKLTEKGRSSLDVDQVVSVMKYTDHIEKQLNDSTTTTYVDCFRGTNLRRTEIACMVWITQAFCGGTIMGYANYFWIQAGFPAENSSKLTTGMFGLGIVGNMAAWFLLRQFGRRTLYLWGETGMIALLLLGGLVSVIPSINPDVVYWILGSLLLVFTLVYNLTIGPTCYVLVAEIPSTRLRVKTVVLARVAYNIASIINNAIIPRMLNPTAWNLKGNTCWPLAGMAFLCLIWIWYRLPETKGLTYIELDILFDKKAPTPKFRQFRVNLENRGYLSLNKVEQSGSRWHGWQGYS